MSDTNNKRKIAEEEDSDYEEEDRKPPAKKKKTKSTKKKQQLTPKNNNNGNSSNEKIDVFAIDLVATTIFSYMNVRELYQISNTSQYLRNLIRHKHVVRSALMKGGHAKTSIQRLVPLIKQQKIYTPTPLRLLRITNGKRCENCNRDRVNSVNEAYGVFFCWHRCISNSKISKKVGFNKKWSPFLHHPRVAAATYSSSGYIFVSPFTDSTGAKAGPLIHMGQMNSILASRGKETVDTYLKKIDDAMDTEQVAKDMQEIVETFEESTGDAKAREKEIHKKKADATKNAIERKQKAVDGMLEKLDKEMMSSQGQDDDGPVWKQFALSRRKASYVKSSASKLYTMDCSFVDNLLAPFLSSPSKLTKKKAGEVVQTIKESFELLWDKGVHDFSFLSDTEEFDCVVKAILRQPSEQARWGEGPKIPSHLEFDHIAAINENDIKHLEAGNDPLKCILGYIGRWTFNNAVVKKIESTVDAENSGVSPSNIKIFAKKYWVRTSKSGYNDPNPSLEGQRAAFKSCMDGFPTLFQTMVEFVSSEDLNDKQRERIWYVTNYIEFMLKKDFDGFKKVLYEWYEQAYPLAVNICATSVEVYCPQFAAK